MKKIRFSIGLCAFASVLALASCGKKNTEHAGVKIVFALEGGEYQNSKLDVVQYYGFKEGSSNLILSPEDLTKNEVLRAGYTLDGWYTTKTGEGDSVVYSGKWDFTTDTVGLDGITLYAKWIKNVKCSYNVCYIDESTGETVSLGAYETSEGTPFNDYSKYAKKRNGYTSVGYFTDKDCTIPLDEEEGFPETSEDLEIPVYVKYIEGDYTLVHTARELKGAINDNIYLMNDIDMAGAEFNFGDYKGKFEGAGHTISNFKVSYDASKAGLKPDLTEDTNSSLYISLFGKTKDAVIQNVTFTDAKIEISTTNSSTYHIYVAALAWKMENTTIKNVSFTGSVTVKRLPSALDEATGVTIEKTNAYLVKDSASVLDNITITMN